MSVQPKDPHFELLAAEYFDEVLDQAGQDELKSLLHEDDRRVKRFAQLAQLDQMINSEIGYQHEAKRFGLNSASSESGAASALVELASLYEDGLQDPMNFAVFREERAKKAAADRRKQWLSRMLISGGLAAALLLAVTLLAAVFTGNPPDTQVADQQPNDPETTDPSVPAIPPRAVATLTNTHNAKWSPPQAEGASAPGSHLSVGSPLHAGTRLTLTHGFAEITTHRGAIVILEAPATVELLDSNAIRLNTGKLVGICETPSSKGFLVSTPHMDITDLGTRFGVDASQVDATEVHVFDGKVELTRPAVGTGQATQITLSQNQAARADASTPGFVDRPSDANQFAGVQILDQAPLGATAVEAGIQAVSGQLQWSDDRFTNRLPNDWSSENAIVYQELRGYTLSTDVAVTIDQPGTYNRFMRRSASATIPRGTVIRSYIVLFKPGGNADLKLVQGSLTFDGQILGIIANEPHWRSFISAVPEDTLQLSDDPTQNILINGVTDQDRLILDADKRTLSFHFSVTTGTADTIRVLVREPVAATN